MKRNHFSLFGALFLFSRLSALGADATFDLTRDLPTDPGVFYANFREAGAGTSDIFATGFQIDITELNGAAVSFSNPFATFCVELEESIGVANYTFDFANLSQISRGRAGEAGTASSAIPVGGIGDLAAARVQALFDNHYTSSLLSDWTFTEASPETHAFQIALWEVSHDSDLSITDTNGAVYVGAQSETTQTNALTLAQTWLGELSGVSIGYTPTKWDVWALEDIGTPGDQDVLFATAIGSSDSSVLSAAVPEPASGFLLLVGGLVLGFRRRR